MRWKDLRRSSNVNDVRGDRAAACAPGYRYRSAAAAAGSAAVVILILAFIFRRP